MWSKIIVYVYQVHNSWVRILKGDARNACSFKWNETKQNRKKTNSTDNKNNSNSNDSADIMQSQLTAICDKNLKHKSQYFAHRILSSTPLADENYTRKNAKSPAQFFFLRLPTTLKNAWKKIWIESLYECNHDSQWRTWNMLESEKKEHAEKQRKRRIMQNHFGVNMQWLGICTVIYVRNVCAFFFIYMCVWERKRESFCSSQFMLLCTRRP